MSAPRTCCETHRDRCNFGRSHVWIIGFYETDGSWSKPGDAKCMTCGGVCTGDREEVRLPEAFTSATVRGFPACRYIDLVTEDGTEIALAPFEARQLAGVLLAQADEIDAEMPA